MRGSVPVAPSLPVKRAWRLSGDAAWSLAIATRVTTPGKWQREWERVGLDDARETAGRDDRGGQRVLAIMPTAYYTRVMSATPSK
jgi:hypothetical protein